jgi:hypothetical protein
MTLGNMRELGVHRLMASCLNDSCRHTALINVSNFPAGTEIHPQGDANTACLANPYSIRGFTTVCLAANSTIFGVVFGVSIEL